MPTHSELRAAGRVDLLYALQLHGTKRVSTLLGLQIRRAGRKPRA